MGDERGVETDGRGSVGTSGQDHERHRSSKRTTTRQATVTMPGAAKRAVSGSRGDVIASGARA